MNLEMPPSPLSEKINSDKNKKGLTRRDFLIAAAGGAAALAMEAAGIKESISIKEKRKPKENFETLKEQLGREGVEQLREELFKEDSESMEEEEKEVLGKTFREQLAKGTRITLNEATRKAIFNNWHENYSLNRGKGIAQGLDRMNSWTEDIKKVFAAHDVPEEFIYLAIAESNFRLGDISPKAAVGPYQIVANLEELETKLTTNKDCDERLDPVRSAKFCANHLRYSYEKFGESYKLALLDYNGGFTNEYLKYLPQKELAMSQAEISERETYTIESGDSFSTIARKFETSEPLIFRLNADSKETYKEWRAKEVYPGEKIRIPQKREIREEDFYQWAEDRINQALEKDLNNSFYTIRSGDDFRNLAKKLHIETTYLQSLNPDIKGSVLKVGQKINVPMLYKKSVDYRLHILSDFKENINYPEKLYAILKVIREEKLESKPAKFRMNFSKARLNQKITLKDVARIRKIDLNNLMLVNPAIKNPSANLEKGLEIRIPTLFHISASEKKHK